MNIEDPRALTHPSLVTGGICLAIGVVFAVLNLGLMMTVPLGIGAYFLGYWNKHMLILEDQENLIEVIGEESK